MPAALYRIERISQNLLKNGAELVIKKFLPAPKQFS
jgi:hypothetical protein